MARWRSPRVLLAACVAVALLLVVADVRGSSLTTALRGAVGAVAGPPERALASARGAVSERLRDPAADRARIAALEAELSAVRRDAARLAAGALSARELREAVALAPALGHSPVVARVVALSLPQDLVLSATLSAGSRAGVGVGQAVVTGTGLVGTITSVAPRVATVRLVGDPATQMAVRVASTGEAGLLRGDGTTAELELLDPLGAMAVGDLVTTLGAPDGLVVPSDLPIGHITQIRGSVADLTRRATVSLEVDPSVLDHVVVLVPEQAS